MDAAAAAAGCLRLTAPAETDGPRKSDGGKRASEGGPGSDVVAYS
jgi:hypothetical protein